MRVYACIDDIEKVARSRLDANAENYYSSGAVDETTLALNRSDYGRILLRPRVLRNVTSVTTSTTILGRQVASPIAIAPAAMQGLAHSDGELGTAKAAKNTASLMILSTYSNTSLEDVISATPDLPQASESPFWLQLYVHQDRCISEGLLKRAEKAGYQALVLTVDAPVLGRRLKDLRNKFSMPPHLKLANFDASQGVMTASERNSTGATSGAKADASLTWKDIDWLRSVTSMKIVLKGIMTHEDALLACQWKVDAIIVSNHGGRQLDTCPSTISILPEITAAVKSYSHAHPTLPVPEVYMDGGIRRGTDVVKALALGARAVFIGRPMLWGLVVGGHEGVEQVLQILNDELRNAMALVGVQSVDEIGEGCIIRKSLL
ncbi:FMN-dependent alpha-hydroxy acid dehydrogenase [Rhizoclosmatium globosum]|uniref:Oxidase FUB9 n=1 Tax=Rhizoclosmatium globosum TaxID=329046 RepID=A0A1Y2C806_9FUNG|nr:FMN-dependent alpha-hydroxy acid dehydrogenase [Rhizoclosmatium globosum]|eukprot:ORY43163.1 FMN-dependent alpha-hydroxy acid dehydrogenase [Rhizoclosmatium globosum]